MAGAVPSGRIASCSNRSIGLSEHPLTAATRAVVVINYGPKPVQAPLALAAGWEIGETWHGAKPEGGACRIGPGDAAVFEVRKITRG